MFRICVVLLAMMLTAGCCASAAVIGDFCPGTGAEYRASANYLLADTLGQFVVDESYASDWSYACGRIEHGFHHSDIHIASIAEIKQVPNGLWVESYSKVVTAGSDQFYREFFITDTITNAQNISGIRVHLGGNPLLVSAGDIVDVAGVIKGATAARYIDYPVVTVRFEEAVGVRPWFLANRWLGGEGTDALMPGGVGVLNCGLLVKTTGRVTYVDTAAPPRFFYIDDGSGLSDGQVIGGQMMRGLRVWIANLAAGNVISPPEIGQYVTVTGVCAPYSASGKVFAQIRPRVQGDIAVVGEPR